MAVLVLDLGVAVLLMGEVKFHVTEGLCCWVAAFSSLGDGAGRLAGKAAMLGGRAPTWSELLRRRSELSPPRRFREERGGRDQEDGARAALGRPRAQHDCPSAAAVVRSGALPWRRARWAARAESAEPTLLLLG